jgi:hypothetical protein
MESTITLGNLWSSQVRSVFEKMHGHQKTGLALMVQGIVLSGTVVLQRIAESLHEHGISTVKMASIERRLARFVANERIEVNDVWQQFLPQVMPHWKGKRMTFILDATPYRTDATILYLGLLTHSRVLPVAWAVMPGTTKWEEKQWEIVDRLMSQVKEHVEKEADCTLIADRGLTGFALVQLCAKHHWHYLLRVCADHTCRRKMNGKWSKRWMKFSTFIQKKGQQWYGAAKVWQEQTIETHVSAYWSEDFKEPWLLISDRPSSKQRIREYALRMRVESTFQDTKSRGWDLESSWIKNLARLERLLLALFLAIWWVTHLAASCIHHGKRTLFDRVDRRDKGLFRLGRLWLLDILRRALYSPAVAANLASCLPFRLKHHQWLFSLSL